ncbi:hypothetical protein BOVATA_048440 [Babesia ovata]|uniref:Extracellular matrix-binding ebh n=1 Tax=Babesia ovata TaxID=189622 RepID=A0A2H6KK40_9APIC|nr:uncharacterized protein BOVATA_048440 [Babesia ovata]GBE63351.1 hypothetical protein BOVATA_048440 [Babesia ovata]
MGNKEKFSYTLLTLWSLSLLYLHIAVVRLDVLRIRSCDYPQATASPRSPSPAAARVKALANVSTSHHNRASRVICVSPTHPHSTTHILPTQPSTTHHSLNHLNHSPLSPLNTARSSTIDHPPTHQPLNRPLYRPLTHRPSLHRLLAPSTAHRYRGKALGDIDARRISLGLLAGQLSGFIGGGEEVQNALVNGLHSNVTQLEKLLETSCGDGECNCDINNFRDDHLKNLQDKFNEVDKIATKIYSLKKQKDEKRKAPGRAPPVSDTEILKKIELKNKELQKEKEELKRQINELQTQLKEPEKQINKKIQELNTEIKRLESAVEEERKRQIDEYTQQGYKPDEAKKYVSIPSHLSNPLETEQAKLKSHEASLTSLESLDKLITFHQNVDSDKNGKCKDILDNLCTGLEKFLGYHDGNYTGSGIVYSDLDRLCDGVMSFLHGVLSNIQPHLGQHKTQISVALNSLNTNKHSGKEGFNKAIGEVVQGVSKYNEGVRESNNHLKSKIQDFDGQMRNLKETVSEILEINSVAGDQDLSKIMTKADNVARDCLMTAGAFHRYMNDAHKHIADLNNSCRHNVNNAVKAVNHEIKRLRDLSTREWTNLANLTNKTSELKALISGIKKQIEDIHQKLVEYVADLQKWIGAADEIMTTALKKVEAILKEVNDPKPSEKANNKKEIEKAAQDISNMTTTLNAHFVKVKKHFDSVKLENLKAFEHFKVPESFDMFNQKIATGWNLSGEIDGLKKELNNSLKKYVDDVLNRIREKLG